MSTGTARTAAGARATPIYGVLARFETPGALIEALEQIRAKGYRRFDAYSPFPIHGLDDAIGTGRSILPGFVLLGGLTGTTTAFLLEWWTSAVDYPMVVGAKPYNSLEAFVPIMFELTVLFASFTCLFGMLALNGLPRLYHPVFKNANFARRASTDGFFLMIEARDSRFHRVETLEYLKSIGGVDVELLED